MSEYAQGHRQRIKNKYALNKNNLVEDYEALELLLTYSIPRKDVKPIAKELLKTFSNLDNVLNADVESLMKVKGVGESTAILISLVKELNSRAAKSKNKNITKFESVGQIKEYFKNLFYLKSNESIVAVTLDNSNRIIEAKTISEGSANFSYANPSDILKLVFSDNAVAVIVAHNHPNGSAQPSMTDINFTLNLRDLLNTVNVKLIDHIIVGESEVWSMSEEKPYSVFFKQTPKNPE